MKSGEGILNVLRSVTYIILGLGDIMLKMSLYFMCRKFFQCSMGKHRLVQNELIESFSIFNSIKSVSDIRR